MPTVRSTKTFAVHDVTPAATPLACTRAHEAVAALAGNPVEACHDFHGELVAGVHVNPLVQAVHLAYSEHRPLVLTPDVIWVTILQGVAAAVAADPEAFRRRLGVTHAGKATLVLTREDLVPGPEAPWVEVVEDLVAATRGLLGGMGVADVLLRGFSTTGPVERMAAAIAVLDVYRPFVDQVLLGVCGIPTITLEGTAADWDDVCARLPTLEALGLERWTAHLRPICAQFARAARGDVDVAHWRAIYKLERAYGVRNVNGWLARLFPRLAGGRPNPALDLDPRDPQADLPPSEFFPNLTTASFPLGLSRVPVRQVWPQGEREVELLGGLVGVAQAEGTLALRPALGWAARVPRLEALLARLARTMRAGGGAPPATRERRLLDVGMRELVGLWGVAPGGFATHGGIGATLLPVRQTSETNWSWRGAPESCDFARLPDGRHLALLKGELGNPSPPPFDLQPHRRTVVAYAPGEYDLPGACRRVADAFEDVLEAILDAPCPRLPDLGPAFDVRGLRVLVVGGQEDLVGFVKVLRERGDRVEHVFLDEPSASEAECPAERESPAGGARTDELLRQVEAAAAALDWLDAAVWWLVSGSDQDCFDEVHAAIDGRFKDAGDFLYPKLVEVVLARSDEVQAAPSVPPRRDLVCRTRVAQLRFEVAPDGPRGVELGRLLMQALDAGRVSPG